MKNFCFCQLIYQEFLLLLVDILGGCNLYMTTTLSDNRPIARLGGGGGGGGVKNVVPGPSALEVQKHGTLYSIRMSNNFLYHVRMPIKIKFIISKTLWGGGGGGSNPYLPTSKYKKSKSVAIYS